MKDHDMVCSFCQTDTNITHHHLIPRTFHSNKWYRKNFTKEQLKETIPLCLDCHRNLHSLIDNEKDLGRKYYTLELLMTNPMIQRYIEWKRKRVDK